MKKELHILIFFWISINFVDSAFAKNNGFVYPIEAIHYLHKEDTLKIDKTDVLKPVSKAGSYHQFEALERKFPLPVSKKTIDYSEFSFDRIRKEFPATPALVNDSKEEAAANFKEIDSTGRWIASFSNENIQVLPVGIKKEISGVEYQLGFTKARFFKDFTELTVFVKIILPQSDEKGVPIELFFGANNVKLSHQGGIVGDANLVLLGDMFIPFNAGNWLLILKGGFDYSTGDTANRTFVTITCDGVKEMGIEGEVQFSRNMLLPVSLQGAQLPETISYQGALKEPIQIPNRVSGGFRAVASDWNDMIVEINLTPFVLASQPDKFMFSVNQAVFDFSDLRTENVSFPQHYYDQGLLLPSAEAWRGVFVQSLEISMPQEFKTKESISNNERVRFEAANLLIDTYGVSGYFSAENIIPLESGLTSKSKGWAYSVDRIGIELASNKLVGADFAGRVVLPISNTDAKNTSGEQNKQLGLGYQGIISENEYSLAVSTLDTISFDVFKAKAELLPNSGVELTVVDGNFRPKAVLNGRMAISASQKETLVNEGQETTTTNAAGEEQKNTIEFKGIEFEGMVIQTVSPIFDVAYLGYKDEVKLANFPVSIANIEYVGNDQEAGIMFDLKVNLMGQESKGFSADARLGVFGRFEEEQFKQKWKFDRLDLSRIYIEANMGAVQLSGGLELMDNDPIYGDGFAADIKGTFGKEGSAIGPITCKAIFGKSDFRYWYVDAAIHGLKINAGPLQISGFAGGAFYKMTRRPNAGPDFSPSGLSYVPDAGSSLGVKAMVFGAIPDETAVAIGAGFEIEFNTSGGVNRMGLFGEAQVMKAFNFPNPVAKLTEKLSGMVGGELIQGAMDSESGKTFLDKATEEYEPEVVGEAAISAKMGMEFDFRNNSFHATMDLYVNVAGGVIAGRASGGRAGWGVIHIDPEEFYVYMGTPTDRLGLKMGVGSFSLETGGYFMLGDRIPGSPPPPPEVADILGVDVAELDYMRDENALSDGKGFAFGTDFKVDTGDMNFLILYARFQAGLGFDIMVKNYGEATCRNTGEQVGINGWYANGQAYAYLQGELGINIKLFFIRKKIPIIKGAAAILMQAKGPNPFWIRGYAAGQYDLLGGLVKGSYRFKVTVGEECEIDNASPLGGIKMITDLTPKDGDSDIDVFAAPQAAFAMRVNEPIIIPEDDGDKTYKVILEEFKVTDPTGKEIIGALEWGRVKDRATFISEDILPPSTLLKVSVSVSFQEKINGVFTVIKENGQKAIEVEERNFTTGTAPDHIPLRNIQYSYPVVDQQHFYKDEYPTGYIQLQRGQDYLFDDTQWESRVKFMDESGTEEVAAFTYSQGDNQVRYKIPKTTKENTYLMSIISTTKGKGSRNEGTRTETKTYDEENTVEIRQNTAETVLKEGEIERISYGFKTSEHKTFRDKVKAISISNYNVGKVNSDIIFLFNTVNNYEGFDLTELVGSKYTDNIALVSTEASLKDPYFSEDIDPIIYKNYPLGEQYRITRRDVNELGVPPKRALPIESDYLTYLENDTNSGTIRTNFPFRYNLARIYKEDFVDLRDQIYSDFSDGKITAQHPAMSISGDSYYFMRYGKYRIDLYYTLPGGINGTRAVVDFKNTLRFRE